MHDSQLPGSVPLLTRCFYANDDYIFVTGPFIAGLACRLPAASAATALINVYELSRTEL